MIRRPDINPINQKNYYTEFLKRDDQILPYRLQQEERRNRMIAHAKNRDRYLAQPGMEEPVLDPDMDLGDDVGLDDTAAPGLDQLGSKVIVLHPGSLNLRIGYATDSLPKTVPMCIARRWEKCEAEDGDGEPRPKRQKANDGSIAAPEKMFGPTVSIPLLHGLPGIDQSQFASEYNTMSAELKT